MLDSCLIKCVTGSECPGSTLASMSKMWRCLQILQAHRRSCEMLENLHKECSAGGKRMWANTLTTNQNLWFYSDEMMRHGQVPWWAYQRNLRFFRPKRRSHEMLQSLYTGNIQQEVRAFDPTYERPESALMRWWDADRFLEEHIWKLEP